MKRSPSRYTTTRKRDKIPHTKKQKSVSAYCWVDMMMMMMMMTCNGADAKVSATRCRTRCQRNWRSTHRNENHDALLQSNGVLLHSALAQRIAVVYTLHHDISAWTSASAQQSNFRCQRPGSEACAEMCAVCSHMQCVDSDIARIHSKVTTRLHDVDVPQQNWDAAAWH